MSALGFEEKTSENIDNVLNLYRELKKKFVELEIKHSKLHSSD